MVDFMVITLLKFQADYELMSLYVPWIWTREVGCPLGSLSAWQSHILLLCPVFRSSNQWKFKETSDHPYQLLPPTKIWKHVKGTCTTTLNKPANVHIKPWRGYVNSCQLLTSWICSFLAFSSSLDGFHSSKTSSHVFSVYSTDPVIKAPRATVISLFWMRTHHIHVIHIHVHLYTNEYEKHTERKASVKGNLHPKPR